MTNQDKYKAVIIIFISDASLYITGTNLAEDEGKRSGDVYECGCAVNKKL